MSTPESSSSDLKTQILRNLETLESIISNLGNDRTIKATEHLLRDIKGDVERLPVQVTINLRPSPLPTPESDDSKAILPSGKPLTTNSEKYTHVSSKLTVSEFKTALELRDKSEWESVRVMQLSR